MTKRFIRIGLVLVVIAALVYASGGVSNFFKDRTAYAVGDLTVNWGVPEGDPIFTIAGAAPGQSETRIVSVTNLAPSSKPVAVRGLLGSDTASLSGVLDITISEGLSTLYGPKTLAEFFTESMGADGVPLSTINAGGSTDYEFKIVFKPEAGNEFQNQTIIFDLSIGVAFTVPVECGNPAQYGTPIFGTSGNDNLRGGNKKDLIIGLEGNDTIFGGNNDDCIIGGLGNNKIDGGNGRDTITSDSGDDSIDGGNEADVIFAGDGNNNIDGGNGDDNIITGTGTDKIIGGNGNDVVSTGAGTDTLDGGNGSDLLMGEAGNDKADGGNGKDTCEAETKIKCEL